MSVDSVDPRAVQHVLKLITNGSVFEEFAKQFVAASQDSLDFVPIGGTHDGGIDGLECTWSPAGRVKKTVYQFSIESDSHAKIRRTLKRLKETVPDCRQLYYATNREVRDQHRLIDQVIDEFELQLTIFDVQWFCVHINNSPKTIDVFRRFEQQHIHAYERSSKFIETFDLKDPRIYVYLRQQIESRHVVYRDSQSVYLDEILMDSLILFALEGTDPNNGMLRSRQEIENRILEITDLKKAWISDLLPKRLAILSKKPRRIHHHRQEDRYCIPYETRLEIAERNMVDHELMEHFQKTLSVLLDDTFRWEQLGTSAVKPIDLAMRVLHGLFYKQGLEFAQFVSTGDRGIFIDQALNEIIQEKISESGIPVRNREDVRLALLEVFRQLVYKGDEKQKEFLYKLSMTYNMLFLLQIDPTLAKYFDRIAGELRIYVDSSILIPAMAECFLESHNQRYTNLLRSARDAGIMILVNNYVLKEIEMHLRNAKYIYKRDYENNEDLYENIDCLILIDQILIRAYFYIKNEKGFTGFQEFMEHFVSWGMHGDVRGELVLWLEDQFGIRYIEKDVEIDLAEVERLTQALTPKKINRDSNRARTDAKQLLTIYKLRKDNNETSETGIFGYKTWWLTSDVTSQRAFQEIADQGENTTTPYIRADYIYNYISLAPSKKHVDGIFQQMFPTLLGVNVSFHVPLEITEEIRQLLQDYDKAVNTPRFRAKLRELLHYLKSHPDHQDRRRIQSFYDELRAEGDNIIPKAR